MSRGRTHHCMPEVQRDALDQEWCTVCPLPCSNAVHDVEVPPEAAQRDAAVLGERVDEEER